MTKEFSFWGRCTRETISLGVASNLSLSSYRRIPLGTIRARICTRTCGFDRSTRYAAASRSAVTSCGKEFVPPQRDSKRRVAASRFLPHGAVYTDVQQVHNLHTRTRTGTDYDRPSEERKPLGS